MEVTVDQQLFGAQGPLLNKTHVQARLKFANNSEENWAMDGYSSMAKATKETTKSVEGAEGSSCQS